MEKLNTLQQIAQLHEEHIWLVRQLETLHVEMQKLVDAPVSAEYKLSVSLAPKQDKGPVVDEDGSLSTAQGRMRLIFQTPFGPVESGGRECKPKNRLKVAVNVRLAVRVMGVLVEEYSNRKLVVERQINKLVK